MPTSNHAQALSTKRVWAGRIISGLAVLFLLFDIIIKLLVIDPVVKSLDQLGYPVTVARGLGTLELICLIIYLIPRSAVLGAIVLTGYLGGAIATHVRVGSPLFSHILFPVYVAALLWGGLYLRDTRVQKVIEQGGNAP